MDRNEKKKKCIRSVFKIVLTALCSLLLFAGCPIQLEQNHVSDYSNRGVFVLRIDGDSSRGRTIMPSIDSYTHIRLHFALNTGNSNSPVYYFDRAWSDRNEPISLTGGNYLLTVYAFTTPPNGLADNWAARSYPVKHSVNIVPGETIEGRNISLKPRGALSSGTGTFNWDISFPVEVTAASMYLEKLGATPDSDYTGRHYFFGGTEQTGETSAAGDMRQNTGYLTLPSGFYRVIFNLTKEGKDPLVWRETLHIFQNMASQHTMVFTFEHFSTRTVTVTFNYNHLGSTNSELTVFYNEINHVPVGLNVRPANQFTFRGWHRDKDCADNRGAGGCCMLGPDDEVAEGDTLFAGWRIADGEWDVSDEDGFTTADLVEPVGDELEHGWWVRGTVSGRWVSGRVQPLGDEGGTLPLPPLALGFNFLSATAGAGTIFDEDGVPITVIGLTTSANNNPAWHRLPPELGGAPIGTAQTEGAEWRITRTGNLSSAPTRNFNVNTDGVTRMFPHVPDTVDRAATVQAAVRNLIHDTIQFRIESEGENGDSVEVVVVEAGFDFDALRAVPNILPHAAGRISALDDVLAGGLTTELTRLRGLSPPRTEEQIYAALNLYAQDFISEITVRATQVERVYWNIPTTNFNTDFRDVWLVHYGNNAGNNNFSNGPDMTVQFRNIPADIAIDRWRVSVEWYIPNRIHTDANRRLAYDNHMPFKVEYVTSGTNFRTSPATDLTQGWRDTSLVSPTPGLGAAATVSTPAIRVSQASATVFGQGNPNLINSAPTRRIRLEVDVPITHIIVPGETSPAFDPVLFQAIGGGIYWRAPVTANPRTTLEHPITKFRTFNPGANNDTGSIQYSSIQSGHQSYLDTAGGRPSLHTWEKCACTSDCDCPHIMGGFDDYNILPPITGDIVKDGIVLGTYTIFIPENEGYVELAADRTGFAKVNARIEFTLDTDIYELVTNANMTVNGNPVQGSGRNRYFVFEGSTTGHHDLDIRITF